MADDEKNYKVGRGRPPLRTRFKKGQSGNPGGCRGKKKLPALLADPLSETVFVTIDGERRQITKREANVHQLVNKSTTADLRATKMLFDMMKEAEQKAGVAVPAPEPPPFTAADEKVVVQRVERICHQILTEMSKKKDERVPWPDHQQPTHCCETPNGRSAFAARTALNAPKPTLPTIPARTIRDNSFRGFFTVRPFGRTRLPTVPLRLAWDNRRSPSPPHSLGGRDAYPATLNPCVVRPRPASYEEASGR